MKKVSREIRTRGWLMLVPIVAAYSVFPLAFAEEEKWGDIPQKQLEGMVLEDFVENTPSEEQTLRVLEMLKLDLHKPILAVYFQGPRDLTKEGKAVKVIREDCTLTLAPRTRAIVDYSGSRRDYARKSADGATMRVDEGDAIAKAKALAQAFDLNVTEIDITVDTRYGSWNVRLYQKYKGYLCPHNLFSASFGLSSGLPLRIAVRPFIVEANTEINVGKDAAVEKACIFTASKSPECKGKAVKGRITIDEPWVYTVGARTDNEGRVIGEIGTLAWPVYIDGGPIVIVECKSGKVLGDL